MEYQNDLHRLDHWNTAFDIHPGTVLMTAVAWGTVSTPGLGWRWMLGLGAAPLFLLLATYHWLPESPHWLCAHGHEEAARQVLARVAATNGVAWAGPVNPPASSERSTACTMNDDPDAIPIESTLGLFSRVSAALSALYGPGLRRTTLLLDGIWFINAITYGRKSH